ncbi:S-adenosyl-L-methionine-dependent methyltransferases superfamily protein [Striga hermonthica]|uniref:S-adenosyl-L-methionine-dependent methyltransferases superfamily protein n=1 Tax=Striga hermonthica TaxID=68872 RepID=A0A9N7N0E7_STRHE|nr:S-adenosyl-L-methionine-dependent methyltransferases superfamily protein [Striga hermonthica]
MSCCSPQLRLSLTATCYSPSPSPALKSAKHCNSTRRKSKLRPPNTLFIKAADGVGQEEEEEEFRVLTAVESRYNRIVILDSPKSRLLLLDSTNNVHSVLNKDGSKWTGSYWDEFVALPPVVPEGPIAIFGLGGGTAAHLMLGLWPSLQLDGWEIDEILIDQSRDYLGLRDLEKHTMDGGFLNIHIGDVFSPDAAISGGYAGIIVDLFAGGKVLPQLEQYSFSVIGLLANYLLHG